MHRSEYLSTHEWGSDLRMWKDGGRVWSMVFRFSPGADEWALMQRLLAIARREGCLLRDQHSGAVFEPEEKLVWVRLAQSRAARFLQNPMSTVREAADEIKQNEGRGEG